MNEITIYTTETCHKCKRIKHKLDQKGTPYTETLLNNPDILKKVTTESNQFSVPIIYNTKTQTYLNEDEISALIE